MFDLNVDLHVAKDVAGDGHIAFLGVLLAAPPDEAGIIASTEDPNIGRIDRGMGVLQRAAGDGDFADGATPGVQFHISCGWALRVMVIFDVAGTNLDIADIATPRDDAAAVIVTNMGADDVRLMQVHVVVENADARVVVEIARADDDVPIRLGEVNRVTAFADEDVLNGELHRARGLDAVRFSVGADNLDTRDGRGAFVLPDLWFEVPGISRLTMRADEMQGWAGTRHDDLRGTVAGDRGETCFGQVDRDRLRQAVAALREADRTLAIDELLERGGVVGLPVPYEGLGGEERGESQQGEKGAHQLI